MYGKHHRSAFGLTALLLPCALSVFCGSAEAGNGLDLLSHSAKAAGRGGASTAVADDSMSISRNPALITQLRGTRLDFTLIVTGDRIRERSQFENTFDEDFNIWPIPVIAYSTDTFALDVDQGDLDLEEPLAPGPFVNLALLQPIQGAISPTLTLAWKLTDTISFGFSVHVLLTYLNFEGGGGGVGGSSEANAFAPNGKVFVYYQADGTPVIPPQPFDAGTGTQVTWSEIFAIADSSSGAAPSPSAVDESAEVEFKLKNIFGAGIMGSVGFLWTPSDSLSVGLGIRTPGIIFNPSGTASLDLTAAIQELRADPEVGVLIGSLLDTYLPDRGSKGFKTEFDVEANSIKIPAQISLGIAWWPLPNWLITADLRWTGWKNSFDEIKLKGSGIDNRDLQEIAGGTTLDYTFRLDWSDQIVFAIGTTFAVNDWLLLRAGFNHGNNPVPSRTASANGMVIENHVTAGASLRFGDWDLDLTYVYGLPVLIRKAQSAFKVEQHQLYIGIGYQF